jgi:hypothetical protein
MCHRKNERGCILREGEENFDIQESKMDKIWIKLGYNLDKIKIKLDKF